MGTHSSDPTLASSRLPNELLSLIASYVDSNSTLASMARASHRFNRIVTPHIYGHIVLTRHTASALFHGLPRSPIKKKKAHFRNKARWDQAVETLLGEYGSMMCPGGRLAEEAVTPECDWTDSEPETDDDEAAPPEGTQAAWARKRQLLGLCRSLVIVQLPPKALCRDLLAAMQQQSSSPEPKPKLFPCLTHLAFGHRAVRKLSDSKDLQQQYRDAPHPFFALAAYFGTPTNVCVACPPAEDPSLDAEYVMRRLRIFEREWSEETVTYVVFDAMEDGDKVRRGRAQVVVSTLPPSVRRLTVHNVRYTLGGLPVMSDGENRAYRYELAPACPELMHERVSAVATALAQTAPVSPDRSATIEIVGIGRNVCAEPPPGIDTDDEDDDEEEDNWDDWDDPYDDGYGGTAPQQERPQRERPALDADIAAVQVVASVNERIGSDPTTYTLAASDRAAYASSDMDPDLEAAVADAEAAREAALRAFQEITAANDDLRKTLRAPMDVACQAMYDAEKEVRKAKAKKPKPFRIGHWVRVAGSKPTKAERDAARAAYDAKCREWEERIAHLKAEETRARAEYRSQESQFYAQFDPHQRRADGLWHQLRLAESTARNARDAAKRHREQERTRRLGPLMPPAETRLRYSDRPATCDVCGGVGGVDDHMSLQEMIREYSARWRRRVL